MTRRGFVLASALAFSCLFCVSRISADDDVILRAMRDELQRSRQLRVIGGGDAGLYFLSYSLTDAESLHVAASMGSVIQTGHRHYRVPVVEARVGSYDFDDTGHVLSGLYNGSRYDGDWPLDDNYPALRQCLWLATDRAYKTALESMARKRAALSSANGPTERLANFDHGEPVQSIGKVARRKIDDAVWTSRLVKLSSIFNGYPDIHASGLDFQAIDGTTYLLNTESTAIRYDDSVVSMYVKAESQTADGMSLRDAMTFQALDVDKVASESDMRKGFTAVAEDIRSLIKAPIGESFSGPALFEPQASAQMFAQLLGDNLRVPRKPLAEPGRAVNFAASELETKLGSRILPEWMDVSDDPTQTAWQGKPLMGFYPFDVEGIPGKPVNVVERGILKSFLTTRQPVKGIAVSNGHARMNGPYGARTAAISNLFIKAGQTSSFADLKKKLIDMCKERGKLYGMLVRKLDYPYSGGGNELQTLASTSSQSGGSVRPMSPPILVYRVYPDGREELVRGLRFRGMSTRILRDIVAASQETALFDFVNNTAPLAALGGGGFLAPTSVISPGVLFEEIEFELPQDQLPKPPIVPSPNTGS